MRMKKLLLSLLALVAVNTTMMADEIAKQLHCPKGSVFGFAYVPGYSGPTSSDLGRKDIGYSRALFAFQDNRFVFGGLHFYGYFINFSSWTSDNSRLQLGSDGQPTVPITFEICVYEMQANGLPGEKIYEAETAIVGKSTFVETSYGTVFTFDYNFTDSLAMEKGWISVAAVDDGEEHAATFALFGHAGVTDTQCRVETVTYGTLDSNTPPAFCLLGDGTLIPGCEPKPTPDDDEEEEEEEGLPRPTPLPASNVTDAGFTANWKIPTYYNKVNGYEVWTYASVRDCQEGTVFHYLNQSFKDNTGGTLEEPGSASFWEQDVQKFNRRNWSVMQMLNVNGAIGVNNELYGQANGCIMSPMWPLQNGDGKVTVKMTCCGRDVTKVNVYMIMYGGRELSCKSINVTEDWKTDSVTVDQGAENCYILIEVDQNSRGYFYIQDIDVYQVLHEGEVPLSLYDYSYTLERQQTSMYIDTNYPLNEGEELTYAMTSFYDSERSKYTDYIWVNDSRTPPEPVYPDEPEIDPNPATGQWKDLGDGANCYIARGGGYWQFTPKHVDGTPIENIAAVNWLWAEKATKDDKVQTSIAQVRYDAAENLVRFATTEVPGNALLAAYDEDGVIVWTWHIWMPMTTPQKVQYDETTAFMDRMLGAYSADENDGDKTWGLAYQWGRLAPFFGGRNYGSDVEWQKDQAFKMSNECTAVNPKIAEIAKGGKVPSWKVTLDTEISDYEEAISKPMTHYSGVYPRDGFWYDGEMTDAQMWNPDKKTNYDPSPAGWRISRQADMPYYFTKTAKANAGNMGFYYITDSEQKTWWPGAGTRVYNDGCYINIGKGLFLWHSNVTAWGDTVYPSRYTYVFATGMAGHGVGSRSQGQSIRCIPDPDYTFPEAVEDVNDTKGTTVTGIYDLSGRRMNELQSGVNIVRTADGKATKMVVK